MGPKGAKTISILPRASPPSAACTIGAGTLKALVQPLLLSSTPATLDGPRQLPLASVAGVSAQISNSSHALRGSAAGFHSILADLLFCPRVPMGRLKLPSLHGAPAYPRDQVPIGTLAKARGWEEDSGMPVKGAGPLVLGLPGNLPAPAGLRALQDAFPVRLDWGKSFAPLDSTPSQPHGRCFEPYPFPVELGLLTLESGVMAANADRSFGEAGLTGLRATGAAGFALDELDPPVDYGFSGALYLACGFPLCPVWLPALFDDVGGLQASLRLCVSPQPVLPPLRSCEDFLPADGPGFSGALACPTPGTAIWEFRKTGEPEEVSVPEHVYGPAPLSGPPAQTAPQGHAESPWQRALRFWRQTPALVRCMALVVPLTVPTLFYGPNISLQSKSASARAGSWGAAIKARATIDLQDDFQKGLTAWKGKPGWEKTWAIDGSGSAQPGRLALFDPTIPLTDYRFEFQGQILSRAMSMALRAADTTNYQAVKIRVLKPGALSSLTLTRYPVIEGREGPKTELAIPLTVPSDTLYKLLVMVQADHFQVSVNGVLADAWTDRRFKSGGIGFFADKGEVARVRSIHVLDKEDFLGRLCYQVSQWTADRPTIGEKHE